MRQRPWHGWLASVNGASQFRGTVEPFAGQIRLPRGGTRKLVRIRCLPRLGFTTRRAVPYKPWIRRDLRRAVQTLANCLGAKLDTAPSHGTRLTRYRTSRPLVLEFPPGSRLRYTPQQSPRRRAGDQATSQPPPKARLHHLLLPASGDQRFSARSDLPLQSRVPL